MIYLDLWGRHIGIPYEEYSVMPIGELSDMISGYLIMNGLAKEGKKEMYIPNLR